MTTRAAPVSMFEYMSLDVAVLFARRVDDPRDLGCIAHPKFNSHGLATHLRTIAVTLGPVEGTSELVARIKRAAHQLDNGDDVTPIVSGGMNPRLDGASLVRAYPTGERRERLLKVWPRIVEALKPQTPFPLQLDPDLIHNILTDPSNRDHFAPISFLNLCNLGLSGLFEGIENFTGLITLDLSYNRLDRVPTGLPSTIRNLSLENNQIRKIRDEEIGSLRHLDDLNLRNNLLETLPYSFSSLNNLRGLNLGRNRFARIPLPLFELDQLVALSLSENRLVAIPDTIGRMRQLSLLNLSSNQLSTLPSSLRSLAKLSMLDLSDNSIAWPSESIPDCALITGLPFTKTLTVIHDTDQTLELRLDGTEGSFFPRSRSSVALERSGPHWRMPIYAWELRFHVGQVSTYKVTRSSGEDPSYIPEIGPVRTWRIGDEETITPRFD